MIVRLALLLPIVWALGFALFASTLPRPLDPARRTDGMVVLTGAAGRVERGVMLMERRAAARLLISGVGMAVRPGDLALRTRAAPALFDCCVDLGREAVDTRSNGEEVADWVRRRGDRSIRLVTSDWHMARAAWEIGRLLPPGVRLDRDAVRTRPRLRVLVNEYNKYLLRRSAAVAGW